jgi:hypothetical protein
MLLQRPSTFLRCSLSLLLVLGVAARASSAQCAEDGYEDNDSLADPAAVSAGTISGLRSCLGDDDYFSILLSAGEEISIDVTFAHAEGDIQLELRDSSGALLASSTTATDDEQIVETPGAGLFVIRVYLAADIGSTEGNDYDLDIVVNVPPAIPALPVPALVLMVLALGLSGRRGVVRSCRGAGFGS